MFVRLDLITNKFVRLPLLADVRPIAFSFSVFSRQGPIRDYFYRRLAPDLQTLAVS